MLVSYYLPGDSLAPPPALLVYGHSGRTEEQQSLFDPLPYGWSAVQCSAVQEEFAHSSRLISI